MPVTLTLLFDGNCRETVTHYAEVFGQPQPHFVTYGEVDTSFDANVQMSEEGKRRIMNAALTVEGSPVLFCDMPDNFPFIRGNGASVGIDCASVEKAGSYMEGLAKGGRIDVPLAEIPGQEHYGMVTDAYDITWTVNVR